MSLLSEYEGEEKSILNGPGRLVSPVPGGSILCVRPLSGSAGAWGVLALGLVAAGEAGAQRWDVGMPTFH